MGGKWTIVKDGPKSRKDRIQSAFEQWRKGGSKGIFASFGDEKIGGFGAGDGGGEGDEPDKENPPLPPVDPEVNPDGSRRDVWEDTVGFYFPKVGMKEGGLVRGGGKAQRGRGRGRMV